jgi:hypothetical protein
MRQAIPALFCCVVLGHLGCKQGGDSFPRPILSAPSPVVTEPPFALSGTVYVATNGVMRPAPDRLVSVYLDRRDQWAINTRSDSNGRYTVRVPESRVFVSAWNNTEQQPCLASASVGSDTTLDVELVPEGIVRSAPSSASPLVTGTVYESDMNGRRQPVQGAGVWLDASSEAWVAYTETDAAGRFVLCRVNAPVRMDVWVGEKDVASRSLPGNADLMLDIDIAGGRADR